VDIVLLNDYGAPTLYSTIKSLVFKIFQLNVETFF